MKVPLLVAAPKPRIVHLAISAQGEEPFSLAGGSRKATHYLIKIEIGGVAGALAPYVGKQPPDDVISGEGPGPELSSTLASRSSSRI